MDEFECVYGGPMDEETKEYMKEMEEQDSRKKTSWFRRGWFRRLRSIDDSCTVYGGPIDDIDIIDNCNIDSEDNKDSN